MLGVQELLWLVNASSVEVVIAVSGLFADSVEMITTVAVLLNYAAIDVAVNNKLSLDGWDS